MVEKFQSVNTEALNKKIIQFSKIHTSVKCGIKMMQNTVSI